MNNQEINLDLSLTNETKCENCGYEYFKQLFVLRQVPQTISPNGKVSYYPIPVFVCENCGHTNEEFKVKIPTKNSIQPKVIKSIK